MPYEIQIEEEFNGVKPKNYLKKRLDIPFNSLIKYLKEKRITLNGKKIKDDSVLKAGDIIKVWLDAIKLREEKYIPQERKNLHIDTIFENKDFLVLNKPSNIIVQGSQDNQNSLSLHLAFLKHKNNDKTPFNYFHVHRIDKNTSGILVCAKNKTSLRDLNQAFRERSVIKKYLCLCEGSFTKQKGEIKINLQRNPEGQREKVSVVNANKTKAEWVKQSHSTYNVLEEYEYNNNIFSLVEVEIKTGVMHQIRVHMKHIGHPIVGDSMYGKSVINREFEPILKRQFLHATSIEFEYNKQKHKVEAPLLADLSICLSHMKKLE